MALGNKEIMANNIIRQMERKGVTASVVCSELGFPMATFSDWIHAKTYPRIDKIEMMANFFNVNKSALVEDWDAIDWSADSQEIIHDDYYFDNESRELAQFLYDNPEYKVLFDASRKVKPEDLKKAVKALGIFTEED